MTGELDPLGSLQVQHQIENFLGPKRAARTQDKYIGFQKYPFICGTEVKSNFSRKDAHACSEGVGVQRERLKLPTPLQYSRGDCPDLVFIQI